MRSVPWKSRMTQEISALGEQWLRRVGLRPTKQRVALAALLIGDGQDRHVTAESLYASACKSGGDVSLATVYNTLRIFCDAGLLKEVFADGHKSWFDTRVDDHPHYYWEDSGELVDAPTESMKISDLPEPPKGAQIADVNVVIRLRRA